MQRTANLARLRSESFDLIVVGGGANGSGIAVDAASRGLKVALLEKMDFSEGTSSRSTKLLHGGVRYLEMAVKRFDRVQYDLVLDALKERALLLQNAPHLCRRLGLITPIYSWWRLPYIYTGLFLYDLLSRRRRLGASRLIGRKRALKEYPSLKEKGLKAGVLYYDGQFNDVRMNLALVTTASELGAVTLNHLTVTQLIKEQGVVCGVVAHDALSGETLSLRSRGVINATGPFTDGLRLLDQPGATPIVRTSSGVHLVLDGQFCPEDTGLLIPKTDDGRVLFILPWRGYTLVGTTDERADVTDRPIASDAEITYLLDYVRRYFNVDIARKEIKAAWSGLRPLVCDPNQADTARLVRDHSLELSPSGLLTVIGGKWTTYRKVAQDTVDYAINAFDLNAGDCKTSRLRLAGSEGLTSTRHQLAAHPLVDEALAQHLLSTYGGKAMEVAVLMEQGFDQPLLPGFPYVSAEVIYGLRAEGAMRPMDIIARRLQLAIVDQRAALTAVEPVVELMAQELNWSPSQKKKEEVEAISIVKKGI